MFHVSSILAIETQNETSAHGCLFGNAPGRPYKLLIWYGIFQALGFIASTLGVAQRLQKA